jgi:hypothetical protein
MAIGIEGRSVTIAGKRPVVFGRNLTAPMRTNCGQGEKFFTVPNDEKSPAAESVIDAVSRIFTDRAGVDRPFVGGELGTARFYDRMHAGHHASGEQQKLFSSDLHSAYPGTSSEPQCLIFKDQTGNETVAHVVFRILIDRENVAKPKAWLDAIDSFQIDAKTEIADQAVAAGIVFI